MSELAITDNVKSSVTDPHRRKDFLDPTEMKAFLEAAKSGRQGARDHLLFGLPVRSCTAGGTSGRRRTRPPPRRRAASGPSSASGRPRARSVDGPALLAACRARARCSSSAASATRSPGSRRRTPSPASFPDGRARSCARAGHFPWVDEPAAFLAAVAPFLAGV